MSTADFVVTKSCENLLMWAVPCFLMVTGALLLDPARELTLKKLFGKYIKRMVLALLIFTFIFRLFDVLMTGEAFTFRNVIVIWLWQFIASKSWAHMWYLYMMVAMYLLVPVYRVIIKGSDEKLLMYFLGVYVLFVSILPFTGLLGLELGFYVPVTLIYPVYMFLGYMIHNRMIDFDRGISVLLAVGCSLAIIILTCIRWLFCSDFMDSAALDQFDLFFFGYASILVVGQTIGVFSLLDRMQLSVSLAASPVVNSLDKCSFGIYLIHMVFVRLIMKHWLVNPYDIGGPFMFIIMTLVFFLAAYVITWAFRKIPGVSKVL